MLTSLQQTDLGFIEKEYAIINGIEGGIPVISKTINKKNDEE